METTHEERTLTELDHARLVRLVHETPLASASPDDEPLSEWLGSADLVPSRQIEPDIVTMYSQVQLADPADGRRYKLTLCYPQDAEPASGFVSVLSPVGASLLGLRAGDTARWHTPDGQAHAATVVALLFQPEASGDFTV